MNAESEAMTITLHGYWRSSASYRVRLAANLKGVAYDQVSYDLRRGEQQSPALRRLAPIGLVPALEIDGGSLTQSLAILEWLEEAHPAPPLLPAGAMERAAVRAMASTIACDIQGSFSLERKVESARSQRSTVTGNGSSAMSSLPSFAPAASSKSTLIRTWWSAGPNRDWLAQRRLWDALSAPNQGIDHLQGDRQSPCGPNPAWTHKDRKHGQIPRRGRGGRFDSCGGH